MNIVGAGFQADTGDCAWFPTEFGLGIDLCVEFLNGIDRYKSGSIADHRGSIGDAQAHKSFVVGYAVDDVTRILWANPVGALGPGTTTWIDHGARAEGDKILIVAAIQREVIDDFIADSSAQGGRGGVHHGTSSVMVMVSVVEPGLST